MYRAMKQGSGRCRALRSSIAATAFALIAGAASAQVLEVAVEASPAGLDPHIVTAFASSQLVLGPIYEGLTALDKDLNIIPGLAESWTASADGKTVTFKLRSGVTFHDGKPERSLKVTVLPSADAVQDSARPGMMLRSLSSAVSPS